MKMESRERALDKLYRRRDRYEIPDWQREDVWDVDRQERLIDSILRGWHLPKLYFLRPTDDDTYFEVVDGQQRLLTIWGFFDGNITLSHATSSAYGGARTYTDLPTSVQDAFDDFELQYEEIFDASDDEIAELFQRLQLGVPLTADEKLNATPGGLRDFCQLLAQHSLFQSKVSFQNRRSVALGVCVRFAYLEIQGVPNQLRLPELQRLLAEYAGFTTPAPVATRMQDAVSLLDAGFPERSPALRNRSTVLSLLRLAARLVESGATIEDAPAFAEFVSAFMTTLRQEVEKGSASTERDFINFQQTVAGNLTSGKVIGTRERILTKRYLMARPAMLGRHPNLASPSDIGHDLNAVSDGIAELIHAINSSYSAMHGQDLFRPTNDTQAALVILRRPAASLSDWGSLVDALYKLTWEGPGHGNRYDGDIPSVVSDIRDLRTQLRHDLDHGNEREVARRRIELGAIFSRYGGTSSPDVLPDAAFPLAQLNLLEALASALQTIKASLADAPRPQAAEVSAPADGA